MTLLVVVLLALFVSLGRWQWQRGQDKQAAWAEFERQDTRPTRVHDDVDSLLRFSRVELSGQFDPRHQFLLDNRSHAGRAGYEVLTPFLLDSGARVLVNRGWIPSSGYRDQLPDVALPANEPRRITGRLDDLPAAGLASGRAAPTPGNAWPKLTSFPTHDELQAALGKNIAQRILLLDPEAPGGFVREWSPPGLSPDRHLSYAIQWWGFAVVLLVLYFGLNFRKVS